MRNYSTRIVDIIKLIKRTESFFVPWRVNTPLNSCRGFLPGLQIRVDFTRIRPARKKSDLTSQKKKPYSDPTFDKNLFFYLTNPTLLQFQGKRFRVYAINVRHFCLNIRTLLIIQRVRWIGGNVQLSLDDQLLTKVREAAKKVIFF